MVSGAELDGGSKSVRAACTLTFRLFPGRRTHHNEPMPNDEPIPDRAPWVRLTGGWLFSLAIHLTACLFGVLFVTGTALLPAGNDETGRGVEVVLARRSADNATAYFSADAAEGAADATDSANPSPAKSSATDSLPDQPPLAADLPSLPSLPGSAAPTEGLLAIPRLTGGGKSGAAGLPGLDEGAVIAADLAAQAAGGGGSSGPTATLKVFGSGPAVGRSFVFVIDRSKSMGGDGLDAISAAAKELSKAIEALSDEQKFQVVAYNEQIVYLDGRRLISADADNRKRLIRFVQDLGAFGPTEHERALAAACSLKPDAIFFFTDGGDPIMNAGQIGRIKRESPKTAIHCIRFGAGTDTEPNFLPALAEATGGSYTYVRVR